MANAQFAWMIEGVPAPVRGQWTNIAVSSPVTVKNPDGTTTDVSTGVNLLYAIVDFWNGSALYLKTLTKDGNCELKATAFAREAVETDGDVSAEESVTLTGVTWIPGVEITRARKRCNPFYSDVNGSFWYLTEKLSDFKNRPDPTPSERAVLEIAQAAEKVRQAVALYAGAGSQTEAEVWRQLGASGGLRSADPPSPAVRTPPLRLASGSGSRVKAGGGKKGRKSRV